jgi:hypothetical protein
MRTVQQQNGRIDWICSLSSGRTPPRARSVLTRDVVFDAAGLACFDVRLVPNKGRLLLVTPSRRRGEISSLHSQTRIGQDPHLQTAPIGLLFSLGRLIGLAGLAETGETGTESIWCRLHRTAMPPSCDSVLQRKHRHRRGPFSGALPGSGCAKLVLLDPPSADHCANRRSAAGAPHRVLTAVTMISGLRPNETRAKRHSFITLSKGPVLPVPSCALFSRKARAQMLLGFSSRPFGRCLGGRKLLLQPRQLGMQRFRRGRWIRGWHELARLESYRLTKGAVKPNAQLPRDLQAG